MSTEKEDLLLKSLFKENAIHSPSRLTEEVMQRIEKTSSEVFEYKPIISKKVWIIMATIFSLIMIYLLIMSGGLVLETPALIELLTNSFSNLGQSFSFEIKAPRIPEIPSTILIAIAAFNVIGVYLIFSYKWRKDLFRH